MKTHDISLFILFSAIIAAPFVIERSTQPQTNPTPYSRFMASISQEKVEYEQMDQFINKIHEKDISKDTKHLKVSLEDNWFQNPPNDNLKDFYKKVLREKIKDFHSENSSETLKKYVLEKAFENLLYRSILPKSNQDKSNFNAANSEFNPLFDACVEIMHESKYVISDLSALEDLRKMMLSKKGLKEDEQLILYRPIISKLKLKQFLVDEILKNLHSEKAKGQLLSLSKDQKQQKELAKRYLKEYWKIGNFKSEFNELAIKYFDKSASSELLCEIYDWQSANHLNIKTENEDSVDTVSKQVGRANYMLETIKTAMQQLNASIDIKDIKCSNGEQLYSSLKETYDEIKVDYLLHATLVDEYALDVDSFF